MLVNLNLVCQVAFIEWTDAEHLRIAPSSPCPMIKASWRWFAKLEEAEHLLPFGELAEEAAILLVGLPAIN
jgi:hypothetical protein